MRQPLIRVGLITAPALQVEHIGGDDPHFILRNVKIGIGFHWERYVDMSFRGSLELIHNPDGTITAVNVIPLEEYLRSVISSEMKSTSDLELLKAHAVISRSWLLAQIRPDERYRADQISDGQERNDNAHSIVRWYDHDDHTGFDVCADDHCQRYQGIVNVTDVVEEAVNSTRGEVLKYEGQICDARFSKCCGGIMEEFATCWAPTRHPYLKALRDNEQEYSDIPDLTREDMARQWIESSPAAFCNTTDKNLLSQVLNNYDMDDTSFYRWQVKYTSAELDRLVHERSGIDFGHISGLVPLKRWRSGRIELLRIEGTLRSVTVGKELEIRRWLSSSHLKSSAFIVDRTDDVWTLRGAGWGHGVGLCQIGAAMMANHGYDYRAILAHYYPGAKISHIP